LHTSAARACRPDQALPVLDESADETDTEAGPELRSGGLVYDRSPELKAQSLRLIRLVTMALGKLRAQAVRALQVVSAAHARAVPRPPAAQPPPPAALSLVPDRQQSAKATLRIVLPDTIEIQAGWSKEVPVAADRGGVEGPVFVQLEGLPKGVMSPPVIIPARVNRSVACVRAQIEARSVELTLRVTARRGSQQTEQPITLIVHANPSLTYRTQGHRLLAGGKPAEAIGAFSRALEIAPGDPIVLNNRGVAHAMLGQLQSAVADCTAAIRLSPRDSLVRYNRGIAYALQGNMTRAALDFDTAIRLRPNYAPAYRSRAELYDRSGSPARAAADRIKAGQIPQTPSPTAYHQLTAEGMVELPLSACGPMPRARTSGLN
jgi:Flp pilus assembly protein TadD